MAQGNPTAPDVPAPAPPVAERERLLRAARSMSVATPHLSVVIVNFCQWRNTLRLTRQLRAAECVRTGTAEVVVIDNHSPSHPAVNRVRRAAGVSLRRFSRNRGFASAANEGCRLGRGDWLLLLNPDMSVTPDFLDSVESLTRRLALEEPTAGVIGFGLRHPDGSRQASCGPSPTLFSTVAGLFRPRAERKCRVISSAGRTRVGWVTGCCVLVRRDCLKEVGGFDEDYFLYYEDADLCLRARERGWSVWFEPSLEVTHHSPLHLRQVPAALRLMTRHALLTFATKHWPRWQTVLLGGMIWVESWLRQGRALMRGDRQASRHYAQLRNLIGDVLRGRGDAMRSRIRNAADALEPTAAEQDGNAC